MLLILFNYHSNKPIRLFNLSEMIDDNDFNHVSETSILYTTSGNYAKLYTY